MSSVDDADEMTPDFRGKVWTKKKMCTHVIWQIFLILLTLSVHLVRTYCTFSVHYIKCTLSLNLAYT